MNRWPSQRQNWFDDLIDVWSKRSIQMSNQNKSLLLTLTYTTKWYITWLSKYYDKVLNWLTPWNPKTNCHVSQFLLGSFKILCRQNLSKNRDLIWAVNKAHVQASTLASSVLKVRGKKDEAYYTACWTLRLNRVCTIVNKSEISANKQRNSARQSKCSS